MFKESETNKNMYQYPECEETKRKARGHKKMKTNEHVVYKEQKGKKKKEKKEKNIYFKIQVVGKMAKFLNKLKGGATLQDPEFTPAELIYLNEEEESKQKNEPLISYENKFLFFCQVIGCLVLIINMWKTSFEIILGSIGHGELIEGIGLFICFLLAFFNLNSEMKNEKMALVNDKFKIRSAYKNKMLFYDIMVLIGFCIRVTPFDETYEVLFFIGRGLLLFLVVHIYDVSSKIQEKLSLSRESQSALVIFKLVMKILIFLHFNSLLLNSLAKVERYAGITNTWVEYNGFQNSENYELYIYAWYWSCTIMSTVGFGDINPAHKNIYEKMFISTLEVVCCIVFGYFLNYIGSLLNIFGESKASYEREIRKLNNYLKNLEVKDDLKDQARSHIFNKYKTREYYDKEEEDEVKGGLNEKLNDNLTKVNNRSILEKCQLKNQFGGELLDSLAGSLQKIVHSPEELVFEENSSEINLWIMQSGSISEIPAKKLSNKPLNVFNKNNNSVGWINFLTGQAYQSWGWADSFTITYKLSREIFLYKLKGFKHQFFKFHEMKEHFIEKARQFEQNCLACTKMSHNVINCPRLHFIPKTLQYILKTKQKKAEFNGQNARYKFKRQNRKMLKSYEILRDKSTQYLGQFEEPSSENQFQQAINTAKQILQQKNRLSTQSFQENALFSKLDLVDGKNTRKQSDISEIVEESRLSSVMQSKSSDSCQSQSDKPIPKQITQTLVIDQAFIDEENLYKVEYQLEKILKKHQISHQSDEM